MVTPRLNICFIIKIELGLYKSLVSFIDSRKPTEEAKTKSQTCQNSGDSNRHHENWIHLLWSKSTTVYSMYRYSVDKKTKGKLIRKHTVPQQGYNNETMHLILADDKGDRVEAVIEEYLISKFNETLVEGNAYAINGFSLAEKSHSFYPANNPYKMLFHDTTTLHRLNDNECSSSMFRFTNFADIKDGSHDSESVLFDVIAEVIDIKIMPLTAECNRSVHLLLRDEEKNTMQCMLWDSYCSRFNIYTDLFWKQEGSLVIILQLCRKDFFNGDVGLTNADNVTKFYVDQDFDEIVSYKSRLREDELTYSYDGSMLSNISFNTSREELLIHRMSSMTLSELFVSQCDDQVHSPGNHLIKLDDKWSSDTYAFFEILRLLGLRHQEDERTVVTYNPYQLGTYHSIIDVEWCSSSRAITYVFKYVYKNPETAMFTTWMTTNERFAYVAFSQLFVWNAEIKEWLDSKTCFASERIQSVNRRCGELYYLQMLLKVRNGPKSYEDITTFEGTTYARFKDVCYAQGMIDNDTEFIDAIKEARSWASEWMLRNLFMNIMTSDSVNCLEYIWESCWENMSIND